MENAELMHPTTLQHRAADIISEIRSTDAIIKYFFKPCLDQQNHKLFKSFWYALEEQKVPFHLAIAVQTDILEMTQKPQHDFLLRWNELNEFAEEQEAYFQWQAERQKSEDGPARKRARLGDSTSCLRLEDLGAST